MPPAHGATSLLSAHRLAVATLALLASSVTRAMATTSSSKALNVLGGPLRPACTGPKTTGFYRDGYCHTGPTDSGRHVVAAQVTRAFLDFTASRGNDLQTPHPPHFPGLVPGDVWCLCALRWREAYDAGVAPPVVLEATNEAALRYVSLAQLREHATAAATAQVTPPAAEAAVTSDGGVGGTAS
jgi:uncharacterized protein